MARWNTHLLSLALAAMAAAGCGRSAPARFYTLNSTAIGSDAPTAHYAVLVGPVSVPAAVDRPQFVIQVAPNRVELEEFNRWVAPLSDAIARTVAGDLAVLLGTPNVAAAGISDPAYRVTIDIQRFESIEGESVLIDAVWAVLPTAGGQSHSGRTIARETVQGPDFAAIPAAHSRALATVSGDIAAIIRAAAGDTRASAESSRKRPKR